ncbi:phosphatase [Thermophilibacter mediterraneus]|uniref:Ppx/GppA phosphatase family protein n=1 Tax=Thermophilibacter mediterraneus TaxID=1871031 RepID=UPI002357EFF6|nr:phosphatase [Thermophilibacter mediterraneus]
MPRVACIDIGTVTARLAVADVEGGRVLRLAKHSEICNLGEGVDATGRLAQGAMERVFACVRGYVESAREAGAVAACCTMTSAARDAENSWELGAALDSLGLDPLVIPGEVEGALTFLGVARDFPGTRILVADNGGGSTELALGSLLPDGRLDLSFVRSVDVGCRRLTEKYLSSAAPPAAADLGAAHDFAAAPFAEAVEAGGLAAAGTRGATDGAPERLVVCGGTVTSLVAISLALEPYDSSRVHLASLTRSQVNELEARLASMGVEERAALPGLQAKRAPVILGGAVAISELMRQTGFERLQASESDLLFGLATTAAAALTGEDSPVTWKPTMRPLR